jgi:hypothetical protein
LTRPSSILVVCIAPCINVLFDTTPPFHFSLTCYTDLSFNLQRVRVNRSITWARHPIVSARLGLFLLIMAAVAGPSRLAANANGKRTKRKHKVHAHQVAKLSEKARIDALERAAKDFVRASAQPSMHSLTS